MHQMKQSKRSSKGLEKPSRADNWKELLMDLFYIAFLIKLGDGFLYCELTVEQFVFAVSRFMGMYMAKFEMDQYLNKFANKDFVHTVFILLYAFGIFVMILNINDTSEWSGDEKVPTSCPAYRPYIFGYTVGWLMTRGIIVFMYTCVAYFVRPQGVYTIVTKAPILLMSIIIISINFYWPENSAVDRSHNHSYFVLAASLVEYIGFALWQVAIIGTYIQQHVGVKAFIPVNINHQVGRTSTFVLSTFGVSFIEIMTPVLDPSTTYYVSISLGFGLLMLMALAYFDVIPSKNSTHALGKSRCSVLLLPTLLDVVYVSSGVLLLTFVPSGTTWIMLNPIYSFCIFGTGVSIKLLLSDYSKVSPSYHRFMLGIFIGLSAFSVVCIRLTHKVLLSMGGKISIFLRCCVAVSHIVVAVDSLYREHQRNTVVLAVHLALSAVFVCIDSYKYRQLDMFHMAGALQQLNKMSSRNFSFGSSFDATDALEGPTYVPAERSANWANVLEEIGNRGTTTVKRVSKKGLGSRTFVSSDNLVAAMTDDETKPIVLSKQFHSTSRILSRGSQDQFVVDSAIHGARTSGVRRMLNADGKLVKTSSLDTKYAGGVPDNVILAKRGQSAAQLKGYGRLSNPPPSIPSERIELKKHLSAAHISTLLSTGKGDGDIPRRIVVRHPSKTKDMQADSPVLDSSGGGTITVRRRQSHSGVSGRTEPHSVLQKVIVRRRKSESKPASPDRVGAAAATSEETVENNEIAHNAFTIQEESGEGAILEKPDEESGKDEFIQLKRSTKM